MAAEGDLLQGSVLLQGRLAVRLHGWLLRTEMLAKASVWAFPWRASPAQDPTDVLL